MPDFQLFRDLTAPLLKAGYFGAAVYFGLQWKLYRDINAAAAAEALKVKDDGDDGDDKEKKTKKS